MIAAFIQFQKFGAGGETYVHPVIMLAVLVAGGLIFVLPRKYVIVPFLAATLLIPMDQVLILGPFHFQMLRLMILVGWLRLLQLKASGHLTLFSGGMNKVDKALIAWTIFTAIATVALWLDSSALINQLGTMYTIFGIYFLARFYIRGEEDVLIAIKALAYISVVPAVVMFMEQASGHNPYAYLGGAAAWVRESLMARDDRFRAMGPFGHPILAGVFGGVSIPLYVALWWKDRASRKTAALGLVAATTITLCSNSSTPLLAYTGGLLALCLWPIRRKMRWVRWGIVIVLVTLHLAMKAPVWALIGRIDLTGGNSGYHRYQLVDQCIRHFSSWWLMGVKSTAEWGWDMWDLANQYVAVADTSGLVPLIAFLAILVYAFKYLGRARRAAEGNKSQELFIWAFCAALFSNCVAFVGISYWDQTMVPWYLLLAMIWTAARSTAKQKKPLPVSEPVLNEEKVELAAAGPAEKRPRLSDLMFE